MLVRGAENAAVASQAAQLSCLNIHSHHVTHTSGPESFGDFKSFGTFLHSPITERENPLLKVTHKSPLTT